MVDEGDIVWSCNGEDFTHDCKEEAIDSAWHWIAGKAMHPNVGDKIYFGTVSTPTVNKLVDADDIIEMLGERAYDIGGEYAEDFPDVSAQERDELNTLLQNWIDNYCKPSFYSVLGIQEYIISEEDMKEFLGETK